jgi:hypothetical protein
MLKSPGPDAEKTYERSAGAILFFLLLYAAILGLTASLIYSKSGFVILRLGTVVLLDRYLFRLLPWKRPARWTREFGVRFGYFAVGALGFYLSHPTTIKPEEPFYLGLALSLAAILFEAVFGGLIHVLAPLRFRLRGLRGRWLRVASGHGLFFSAVVLPLFVLHLPQEAGR